MNAEAIIQAGDTELESFQLPNCTRASAVRFVLLIHPSMGLFLFSSPPSPGEQDSFCFQSPSESSSLRMWFSREKKTLLGGLLPPCLGQRSDGNSTPSMSLVPIFWVGRRCFTSLGNLYPLHCCWGSDISLSTDNYLEIMRYLHLWFTRSHLYCFPGAVSGAGCFILVMNNWRPRCDVNQSFEGGEAGTTLGEQPALPVPYFLLKSSQKVTSPWVEGGSEQRGGGRRCKSCPLPPDNPPPSGSPGTAPSLHPRFPSLAGTVRDSAPLLHPG